MFYMVLSWFSIFSIMYVDDMIGKSIDCCFFFQTSESGSGDEEIISIKDTDSDDSSSDNKLQIDEDTNSSEKRETPTVAANVETIAEVNVESENKAGEKSATVEETSSNVDPLNQAQISMLTDDNSVLESEQSDVNLNYSDENKAGDEAKPVEEVPMETGKIITCIYTSKR